MLAWLLIAVAITVLLALALQEWRQSRRARFRSHG